MSKSEYKRYAAQMPEVFKVIRDAALDEAIEAVNREKNETKGSRTHAIKAIEKLKHE